MPVDTFTLADFEAALPTWKETVCLDEINPETGNLTKSVERAPTPLGLIEGEYAYLFPLPNGLAVHIRSSVKRDGVSADCGKDSIRTWLVDASTGEPWGSKISRWTTRVPGWRERLIGHLRLFWRVASQAPECCGRRAKVYKVQKSDSPNCGKWFYACTGEKCKFRFLEWVKDGGK